MHTYILLDRSGSMVTNWDETLSSLNSLAAEMAGSQALSESFITVAAFDDTSFDLVRLSARVKDFKDITRNEVAPRGMTPLYDSIQRLGVLVDQGASDKASIVIITDGAENASREINKDTAKAILDRYRKMNYDVTFIGADFDNMAQSKDLGNSVGSTIMMRAGHYNDSFAALHSKTAFYASSGTVRSFTEEEKLSAGDTRG